MKWTRPFNPTTELVWIGGWFRGPEGHGRNLVLVLDPGTSRTLIDPAITQAVGFTEDMKLGDVYFRGVAGPPTRGFRLPCSEFEALGRTVSGMEIIACPLSDDLEVDGVLGLDFVRGMKLTLDFEIGLITLAEPGTD